MITRLCLSLILLEASAVMSAHASQRGPGSLDVQLETRVENYSLAADDFVQALLKIADEYKISMGIAWVKTPSALPKIKISRHEVTIRDVIQTVATAQPGYTFATTGGLVHVFAAGLVPGRENFLNVRVSDFEASNQKVEVVGGRLGDVVRASMSPPKPYTPGRSGGTAGSLLTEVGDPDLTLHLRDVTVEDILDALTLNSGRGVWIVTFAPVGELTPTGFRRTVSPVSGQAVPDVEQPVWELLRWGRKPY